MKKKVLFWTEIVLVVAGLVTMIWFNHGRPVVPMTFEDSVRAFMEDTNILNHSELKPIDTTINDRQ